MHFAIHWRYCASAELPAFSEALPAARCFLFSGRAGSCMRNLDEPAARLHFAAADDIRPLAGDYCPLRPADWWRRGCS